ncbi:SLATT domain-containing protein, partial [Klebsiella oxytoca]|nr:SLATT domain-containing protein [Klebsiella oxytoca]
MNEKKIIEIANLENDCKIGKDRHFIAADRKNKWRIYLGLFAVVGSAIISSGIGKSILSLLDAYIKSENWAFWDATLSHILPLLVGISTAIIGFLGLEKQTAQHRYVGNAYIEIS